MSLHPEPIGEVPAETACVSRAAFPKGTLVTRLRDEFSALYQDEDFRRFYPAPGQPGLAPWRLALVTVFQFLEQLSDRQAADAVRGRIDWKYALGLELTDPGFHFSVLTEFRARLVAGGAEHLLLDTMLERFKARGLVKARGKQRTDSTHVLGAVHDLHLLELVAETLRAALDDLAAAVPDWLREVAQPAWFERYGHVAGFACYNDGSVRDFQRHTHQFTPGKNFPDTGAFGPWMVTPDEMGEIGPQRLQTRLNGQVVQDALLSQMIFGLPQQIEYCSTFTRLEPGEVIVTGTPGGVGARRTPPLWMKPGDTVEVEIDGVGLLRNPVTQEAA